MNDELRDFIGSVANTDVKKDLILYFHGNPALDSPQGLSMWINRRPEEIAAEIDELVDAGILQRSGSGPSAIYMYGPSPEQRNRVEQFVDFYKSDRRMAEDQLEQLRKTLEAGLLREVQREQSKTKTILTSMVDGVIVTDMNHVVVLYNPSASRLIGVDGLQLGRTLRECSADPGAQELAAHAEELLKSNLTMMAQEIKLSTSKPTYLKAHLSTIRDENDEPLGVVAVLRDITELRLADEQRVAFVHMMAHELRSPLTSIKGFAQSITRGLFGGVAQDQKEPLEIILQQSDRLLSLINDLLEMARMEAGKKEMKMEPLDLRQMLEKIVRGLKPQAEERKHTIKLEIPDGLPPLDADPDAMDHVFINLVSNAIKYTLPGGTVTVRGEERGEHVSIAVSDTGIGIPPEALPKLFSRFFRVKDAKTREVTGTGLGLAIVKNYVEAHMGTIEVDTEVNVGTTFTVTLSKRQEARKPSEVEATISELDTKK